MITILSDNSKEVARLLLEIKAVSFQFDPPFTYTTGLRSPIYLDNRLVMSYPDVRKKICAFYADRVRDIWGDVDVISATATGAIPMGAWLADELGLPLVFVRGSAKGHGKGNQMEGVLKKNQKVLIVEDHISTGASALENARVIGDNGGVVVGCIGTTSYETEVSKKNFERSDVRLEYLVSGKQIVEQAVAEDILSDQEKESVFDWFSDPTGWFDRQS